MLGEKLRFRFAKTGTLRLLSHHDLMRCTERMLRRADLPFKSTAGFHPSPRVVFALSLPLGIEGHDEVVEMEFTSALDGDETLSRLNAQVPVGLQFRRVSVVPLKATARPRRVVYSLRLPPNRVAMAETHCTALMAEAQVWVERLKPSAKRLNIRPYLRALSIQDQLLTLDLWVTQTGTARADELFRLLALSDLLEAGTVARTILQIHDEVPNPDPADVPPSGPAETLPLESGARSAPSRWDDEELTAAEWGASPAGPVVE